MNKSSLSFEHYRGNEEFVKRIYDYIDQCEVRKRIIVTPFFSPDQSAITRSICGKQIMYKEDGGYKGAERVRFAFLPFTTNYQFPTVILKASVSATFGMLSHRDVLGALMNLGLRREMSGDILVERDAVYLVVDKDIKNFVVCNLTKIKRQHVHFKRYEGSLVSNMSIRYQHKIVSSMRLDTIVACLANVSRGKAQEMIASQRVKVNHVVLEQSTFVCNNNSAISIRGYGRFYVREVIKKTKKDRLVIDVGVYE